MNKNSQQPVLRSRDATVGVIGVGNIGRGVATSLIRSDRWRVLAWDTDAVATTHLEGAGAELMPPGAMAETASTIIFLVPGTEQIVSCLRDGGILKRAGPGLTIYDLTTSDPGRTRRVAAQAAKHGVAYLDAGTSGGPFNAEKGKLVTMVGGNRAAFDRSRQVLDSFCEKVFYIGDSGAGHTLKLLHNIVCHATTLATAEAGQMAERAGISLQVMIDVFNASNARSYASEFRFPNHIISQTWDGRSRISNLHKDITMGARLGKQLGVDTTFSRATLSILERAVECGMSEQDYTLLYRDMEAIRKVPRRRKRAPE